MILAMGSRYFASWMDDFRNTGCEQHDKAGGRRCDSLPRVDSG